MAPRTLCLIAIFTLLAACMHPRAIEARAMSARQADVSAIDVGPIGHEPSMLAAAPLILAWLAELDAAAISSEHAAGDRVQP
jgi:hypothetical protein